MIDSSCDDFFNRSEYFLKIDVHIMIVKSLTVTALTNDEMTVKDESHCLNLTVKSVNLLKETERIDMKILLDKALDVGHT